MSVIWITGGYGFIGLNLANYCQSQGDKVYGLGHVAKEVNTKLDSPYQYWLTGDINSDNLEKLSSESGLPDVIYHLAGGASVGLSILNPREDFKRTVITTSDLLDWVRTVSTTTRVVCASSAAVYGSVFHDEIEETKIGTPYSPYGFHKAMQENLCQSYIETYDLNISIVRLFSVYGCGLKKQLLWDLCQKLKAADGKVTLHGSGNELRDWLYINDAVNLLYLVGSANENIVVNGGTGVATSILNVAQMLIDAWGEGHEIAFSGIARKGDPSSLVASTKMAENLGFHYETDLQTGLEQVVKWFKETQR